MKKVCFTGHRPQKFSFGYNEEHSMCKKLKAVLRNEIVKCINKGYKWFISGMALGIDQWAVEILIELKSQYSDIIIEGAIPCKNQEKMWIDSSKRKYGELIKQLDKATYVTEEGYTKGCMQRRNRYMVDSSDIVIAVYNGGKGGTYNCLQYALKKKRHIIRIKPQNLAVEYYKNGILV